MNDEQAVCLHCGVEAGKGKSFCHNCGNPVAEEAVICVNCGVALTGGSQCNGSTEGIKPRSLATAIILSIVTCGIYAIVWWYQLAERLHETGVRRNVDAGVTGGSFLLWMILGSFLCGIGSLYALYMILRALNRLSVEYNSHLA